MLATLAFIATIYKPNWVLTFSQEFQGAAGSAPNPKVWNREVGGSGYGNNELESYTDSKKNAYLDGKGNLVIVALKEPTTGKDGIAREYSSARMTTQGKFSQTYGRIEARMKLPIGKGIWPAFWMLGDSISKIGWPAGGEIDIMEYLGHQPKLTYGTLHGPGYSGANGLQGKLENAKPLSDDFHVFGIIWSPDGIDWTLDGKVFANRKPSEMRAKKWVFDDPFFIILNLAVGGYWPGNPDATTVFPQQLVVDYVRVYKDTNLKVNRKQIDEGHRKRIAASQEFKGAPVFSIPGVVNFCDFRPGGYKDSTSTNDGGDYRPLEGVDIGGSGVKSPKYSIGYTTAGEWLEYDIDVKKAGEYDLTIEAACEGQGGEVALEIKGKRLTSPTRIADTGGWIAWKPFSMGNAYLPAGRSVLRLVMVSNGPKGPVGNVLKLVVRRK